FPRRGYPLASLFHRVLDGIEFGAQGTIDHTAAELDDQSADNGRIDLDVEVDILAGNRFERSAQRVDMLRLELFGHRDLGGSFALMSGDQWADRLEWPAHGEGAVVPHARLEKIRGEAADPGAIDPRRQSL